MKKRMALLLAAVLVLTLMTGCSKKEEKDPSGQSTPSEQTPSNGDTTPNGGTASSGALEPDLPATNGDLETDPSLPASNGDLDPDASTGGTEAP